MTVNINVEPEAIVHLRVSEKLTRSDYEDFVPVVDDLIAKQGGIRMLWEMHDFHGWTLGAMWSDLTFGIKHFTSIDRLAMVGEKSWQKGLTMFIRPFTRARVRYFLSEQIAAAWQWLREARATASSDEALDFSGAPDEVAAMLRQLGDAAGSGRQSARQRLVEFGAVATPHLIAAAQRGDFQMRLAATKALAAIADPAAVDALVGQFDDAFEIGWAAAEGVKRLGRAGAEAALHQLIQHPNSHGVQVSTHHALKHMQDVDTRAAVAPVAAALAGDVPVEQAPLAALAALDKLSDGSRSAGEAG